MNDLLSYCLNMGEKGQRIIDDWDYEKNVAIGLYMNDIKDGSNKKAYWKCSKCGYEYEVNIYSKSHQGSTCAVCNNKVIVAGLNDLETWCKRQGESGARLMAEWDFDKNNEEGIYMNKVAKFSQKKANWLCSCHGHSWKALIASRTFNNNNCPICASQVVSAGFNDLRTWCNGESAFGQKIIKEWDSLRNRNDYGLTMENICGKSGKKVHWICERCGEGFDATVVHRTSNRSGCPHCSNNGTSYPELFIYNCLKQVFPNTIHRGKAFNKIEYDISIPEKKLCIEYGSTYWHEDRKEIDEYKKNLCKEYGVDYLEIIEDGRCNKNMFTIDYIHFNPYKGNKFKQYELVVEFILKRYEISIDNIDLKSAHDKATNILRKPSEEGKSVDDLCKVITNEWLPELNNGLTPDCFTVGSHKRINWKCASCGNIWDNTINSRIRFKSGCPKCLHNIFR